MNDDDHKNGNGDHRLGRILNSAMPAILLAAIGQAFILHKDVGVLKDASLRTERKIDRLEGMTQDRYTRTDAREDWRKQGDLDSAQMTALTTQIEAIKADLAEHAAAAWHPQSGREFAEMRRRLEKVEAQLEDR